MVTQKDTIARVKRIVTLGPEKATFPTAFVKLQFFEGGRKPTNDELAESRYVPNMWMCRLGKNTSGGVVWVGLAPTGNLIAKSVAIPENALLDRYALKTSSKIGSYRKDLACLCDGFLYTQLQTAEGLTNMRTIEDAMKDHLNELLNPDERDAQERLAAVDKIIETTDKDVLRLEQRFRQEQDEAAAAAAARDKAVHTPKQQKSNLKQGGEAKNLDKWAQYADPHRICEMSGNDFEVLLDSIIKHKHDFAPSMYRDRHNTEEKARKWLRGWARSNAMKWSLAHPGRFDVKMTQVDNILRDFHTCYMAVKAENPQVHVANADICTDRDPLLRPVIAKYSAFYIKLTPEEVKLRNERLARKEAAVARIAKRATSPSQEHPSKKAKTRTGTETGEHDDDDDMMEDEVDII